MTSAADPASPHSPAEYTALVLRVFTDADGRHGNPLGVLLHTAGLPSELGPRITAELGFAETVFVDDVAANAIRIFHPADEMKLAGHPAVGAAWLLGRLKGAPIDVLRPRLAGEVAAGREADGRVWIRGALADCPEREYVQLGSPAEVDALPVPDAGTPTRRLVWAWEDEAAGTVRARNFSSAVGTPEDEATGSAAMVLADLVGRPVRVRQGAGSLLDARPAGEGRAEVAGHVTEDPSVTVRLT
ncbi:hypothetical protein BIV57_06845 [Mangrovactinospora gilvigrisea]|uniref:PhzF family phenazine biosynthesis protein n=1 Tax=Mangrovactinospora gilvigrisea TaxID=1428644 RepID=A0A1J7BHX0_9ACTN|nr:PhzF family phenazine biosynthesis protein [Mangrovactinospora gilvigrisea]OIV38246.1 hypothetical protein BIV57_06845 [Mangrovactinospora gilvigrisea]